MIKNFIIITLLVTNVVTLYFANEYKNNKKIEYKTKTVYVEKPTKHQPKTNKIAPKKIESTQYFYRVYLANGGEVKADTIRLKNNKIYIDDKNMTAIFNKSEIKQIEKINTKTMIPVKINFK